MKVSIQITEYLGNSENENGMNGVRQKQFLENGYTYIHVHIIYKPFLLLILLYGFFISLLIFCLLDLYIYSL